MLMAHSGVSSMTAVGGVVFFVSMCVFCISASCQNKTNRVVFSSSSSIVCVFSALVFIFDAGRAVVEWVFGVVKKA